MDIILTTKEMKNGCTGCIFESMDNCYLAEKMLVDAGMDEPCNGLIIAIKGSIESMEDE